MQYVNLFTYPVLFYKEPRSYSAIVPDLKNGYTNATCGKTLEETIEMVQELISIILLDIIEENKEIPKASKIENLEEQEEDFRYITKFAKYIAVDVNEIENK